MRRARILHRALIVAVLVPALALTVLRLLEPGSGPAVRTIAFTPVALPLYLLAMLLLAVPAWRSWWARAGLILATTGFAVHAIWWGPLLVGAKPAVPDDARQLTVMTANMFVGAGDGTELAQAVREHRVDLLVVEEITQDELADLDAAGLKKALPYRIGEARPDGDTSGTMIFADTPISDPQRLPTDMQSWQVEVAGLKVFGIHPVSPEAPALWAQEHAQLRDAALEQLPDLILGDFNATLDHRPLQRLLGDGWRDAASATNAGWQPTWPANGEFRVAGLIPLPPLVSIDHVLTGPQVVPISTQTVHIAGTDHRALIARVAVTTGS